MERLLIYTGYGTQKTTILQRSLREGVQEYIPKTGNIIKVDSKIKKVDRVVYNYNQRQIEVYTHN